MKSCISVSVLQRRENIFFNLNIPETLFLILKMAFEMVCTECNLAESKNFPNMFLLTTKLSVGLVLRGTSFPIYYPNISNILKIIFHAYLKCQWTLLN